MRTVQGSEAALEFSFQWETGDLRLLEKLVKDEARSRLFYGVTLVSRIIAFAATLWIAALILPGTDIVDLALLCAVASLSIWVSWAFTLITYRTLERISVRDPRRVGWNSVTIDRSGIYLSTEISLEYTSWLGVVDVEELDGALFVRTGPAHGYLIPARAFESPANSSESLARIDEFRKNPETPRHADSATNDLVRH